MPSHRPKCATKDNAVIFGLYDHDEEGVEDGKRAAPQVDVDLAELNVNRTKQ